MDSVIWKFGKPLEFFQFLCWCYVRNYCWMQYSWSYYRCITSSTWRGLRRNMPWLNWSVSSLSPRKIGFKSRPVHVAFVVKNLAKEHVFHWTYDFPLQVSFNRCSVFTHPCIRNVLKLRGSESLQVTLKATQWLRWWLAPTPTFLLTWILPYTHCRPKFSVPSWRMEVEILLLMEFL
jgi:hypothetical protein